MRRALLAGTILAFMVAAVEGWAQVAGGFVVGGITQSSSAPKVPYSADTLMIRDQVLADGNHIHRESHGKIYRDSQGRTRNETEMLVPAGAESFSMISINDPVQRMWIHFDTRSRTAQVMHFPDPQKIAADRTAVPPKPAQAQPTKVEFKHEDLGTQDIEGVLAHGTRITRTIPAGAEGNDQPIEVVTEHWMSQELGTDVLTKTTDPRNGNMEHRLINIQRGEPDPSLFQVPADYKVKDNDGSQ